MRVSDAMTHFVHTCVPESTIQDCARIMAEIDVGIMPVSEHDKLVGMITDRDIAIRAVAAGKGPETPVSEIMTEEVRYVFEDEELFDVAENMGENKLRRMPVVDRNKRLVGILSLGDLAKMETVAAAEAVSAVSQKGGPHSQTASM